MSQAELGAVDAELAVIGLYEGEALPEAISAAPGAADAKGMYKRLTAVHPEVPGRVLAVGLGKRADLGAERLRVAAALAAKEAERLGAASLAWALPQTDDDAVAATALR